MKARRRRIPGAIGLLWMLPVAPATDAATPPAASELSARVEAATPDPQYGRILYLKRCAGCHRPHAWGDGPREIPALAGQRESYLIAQLVRFTSGQRPGSAMHGPAMYEALQPGDVDRPQAFRDLTAYLASIERNPHPEYGDGRALPAGARAYAKGCAACHGEAGAGSDRGPTPRIAGQHFHYLLSRLRDFETVHGGHGEAAAAGAGTPPTVAERQPIADYLSRLGEPGADSPR
ncbi:MAG TPA: c-type cytochrome [Steroidobacteraceae bacterium]|jgi:cytochrome c553|nr:c-type cytochrome [Steroidobacteraceae bacterium]